MPDKNVYLFDDSNNPLKVAGIQIELYDSVTCRLIDRKLSINRHPHHGYHSTEWGADLHFTTSNHPLDIFITDVNYDYPGNTVRYLNGRTNDRIDLDLMKVPAGALTTHLPPNSTFTQVGAAIQQEPTWEVREKVAVVNLLTNYTDLVYKASILTSNPDPEIQHLIANWENGLSRLGINGLELGMQAFAQEIW